MSIRHAMAVVAALARDVQHVVAGAGSRSTPLLLAADAHPGLHVHMVPDERQAAFYALGIAKASGRPAAVLTTSGTAVANLLPAAVEADMSATPLVLLTADRPPSARGTGANQTIVQPGLLVGAVRGEVDLDMDADPTAAVLALLDQAVARCPGPVHLNVPLAKPLEPTPDESDVLANWAPAVPPRNPPPAEAGDAPAFTGEGLVLVGPHAWDPELGPAVQAFARAHGAEVYADALSGARFGHDVAARLPENPDWVLRIGALPTSKHVLKWLEHHPAHCLDETGRRWDPYGATFLDAPAGAAAWLNAHTPEASATADAAAEESMREDHAAWWRVRTQSLEDVEPAWVPALLARADALFVGNSLVPRDLDRYGAPGNRHIPVFSNRGASGIDGLIATAAGVATIIGPTWLVLGDVSFEHDVGSLRLAGAPLRILRIDNGGGQIFAHLPIRDAPGMDPTRFERLFATPPVADAATLCAAYGLQHADADLTTLGAALDGDADVVSLHVDGAASAQFRAAQPS